jgi:hypothetical protein
LVEAHQNRPLHIIVDLGPEVGVENKYCGCQLYNCNIFELRTHLAALVPSALPGSIELIGCRGIAPRSRRLRAGTSL